MTSRRTGEPTLTTWAVIAASFALSAATWVALAQLAGFTQTIGVFRLAWLMPVCVDGYVVVSLVTWMAPVPERVARFARTNTYVAALVGVAAQSSYHALITWTGTGGVVWRTALAAVVGLLPPGVAALSIHMRALTRRTATTVVPVPTPVSVPVAPPAVVERVDPLGLDGRADLVDEPADPGTPEPVPAPTRGQQRRLWSDQQIIAVLQYADDVPRGTDGKVAIEYVQREFGIGQERAVKVLKLAGLHRAKEGEPVPGDVDEDVPADEEMEAVPA